MAFSGARVIRLGVIAIPRQTYGSFAGKAGTEVETGAGRARRYVLPDGKVYTDEAEALLELQRQIQPKKKRKSKSRSIKPKEETPLPVLVERLPPPQKRDLDPNLVAAVQRKEDQEDEDEEEAIVAILMIA